MYQHTRFCYPSLDHNLIFRIVVVYVLFCFWFLQLISVSSSVDSSLNSSLVDLGFPSTKDLIAAFLQADLTKFDTII